MSAKRILLAVLLASALLGTLIHAQTGRACLSIVGSSTVHPFTTTVAEQSGKGGKFKAPMGSSSSW